MKLQSSFLACWMMGAMGLLPAIVGNAATVKFEGSITNDSVTAFSGKSVAWRFFTGGPVRYDPVVSGSNVYAGSDDGCLYCLDAATGKVVWKFFAGPSNRKMIGNERMISVWHISGGPVIQNGRIYFAAGTWPMMGVFIYCLDAKTGKIVWVNDHTDAEWRQDTYRANAGGNSGSDPEEDPENKPKGKSGKAASSTQGLSGRIRYGSYSVSPKGQCEIENNRLLVPCGKANTPVFDLETGKLITVINSHLPRMSAPEKGTLISDPASGKSGYLADVRAARNQAANWPYATARQPVDKLDADPVAQDILRQAAVADGYCLVLGIGDGHLINGLLADSTLRLVVVDADEGKVDAFRRRLDVAGYYGLRVSAIAGNPRDAGLPPYFASLVVVGDPMVTGLGRLEKVVGTEPDPPGFAQNTSPYTLEGRPLRRPSGTSAESFVQKVFPVLRPYGGVLCLSDGVMDEPTLKAQVKAANLDKAEVRKAGTFTLLRRLGALTGAGSWSHQKGNAGNVFSSRDELVRGPLGVLWFGGAASDPSIVYPVDKAGRGISPLVVGGRILLERPGKISAADVYTGRLLWQWACPDQEPWFVPIDILGRRNVPPGMVNVGKFAGVYGVPGMVGRMAATEDTVYVVSGRRVYALDAATGKPRPEFRLAEDDRWGPPVIGADRLFLSSERRVLAVDRRTGKVNWAFTEFGGQLAAGGGKVFCWQGLNASTRAMMEVYRTSKETGSDSADKQKTGRLVALDAERGVPVWTKEVGILRPGWPLVYSEEHDLLFADLVYVGKTGADANRLNRGDQFTAVLRDRVLARNGAGARGFGLGPLIDLASGAAATYPDPITGQPSMDLIARGSHYSFGCGPAVLGENIAASRIISSVYYDLRSHSGVCSLNSFRSSCTATMIPADGVLCALNQSTCLCVYPIYTSAALIHMPEADMWTYFPHMDPAPSILAGSNPVDVWTNYPPGDPMRVDKPVKRLGINFGAPGDRMAENGTLWVDYPVVGGPSPAVQVTTEPAKPVWFRYHQSRMTEGSGLPWVCSSGAKDLKSVTIQVNGGGPYRVREYYAEPAADNDLKLRSSVTEHRNIHAGADGRLKWMFAGKGYVCGLEIIDEGLAER